MNYPGEADREIRDGKIVAMRAEGKSYREIGCQFGLTRARVHQICEQRLHASERRRRLERTVEAGGDRSSVRVDDLRLSERTVIRLRDGGVFRVDDLAGKSAADLMRLPGFGRKSLNELEEALSDMELRLGELHPDRRASRGRRRRGPAGLGVRVEDLGLSVRAARCLKDNDIHRIGDLVRKSEAALMRLPGFGRRYLSEIRDVLADRGFDLNMERLKAAAEAGGGLSDVRVDDLRLSVRCANRLKNGGVLHVGDLVRKSEADLMRLPKLGPKSLHEIERALARHGLGLRRGSGGPAAGER